MLAVLVTVTILPSGSGKAFARTPCAYHVEELAARSA